MRAYNDFVTIKLYHLFSSFRLSVPTDSGRDVVDVQLEADDDDQVELAVVGEGGQLRAAPAHQRAQVPPGPRHRRGEAGSGAVHSLPRGPRLAPSRRHRRQRQRRRGRRRRDVTLLHGARRHAHPLPLRRPGRSGATLGDVIDVDDATDAAGTDAVGWNVPDNGRAPSARFIHCAQSGNQIVSSLVQRQALVTQILNVSSSNTTKSSSLFG